MVLMLLQGGTPTVGPGLIPGYGSWIFAGFVTFDFAQSFRGCADFSEHLRPLWRNNRFYESRIIRIQKVFRPWFAGPQFDRFCSVSNCPQNHCCFRCSCHFCCVPRLINIPISKTSLSQWTQMKITWGYWKPETSLHVPLTAAYWEGELFISGGTHDSLQKWSSQMVIVTAPSWVGTEMVEFKIIGAMKTTLVVLSIDHSNPSHVSGSRIIPKRKEPTTKWLDIYIQTNMQCITYTYIALLFITLHWMALHMTICTVHYESYLPLYKLS